MKNLEFDLNSDFLKARDLQVGCLYLVKDGRLVIYLGKDTLDRFIFYNIANCLYMRGYRNMTLAHYDAQVQYLVAMARAVLSRKVDVAKLGVYRSIPKLCCEFPYIAFSLVCADWYNKSMVGMKGFPVLASPSRPANSGFVSSKDLIPGRCYYTGSC